MQEFHSQKELLEFLRPVLKMRSKQLKDAGIFLSELEIFEYLKEKKWKNQKDLHIYEIVDDIENYQIERDELG